VFYLIVDKYPLDNIEKIMDRYIELISNKSEFNKEYLLDELDDSLDTEIENIMINSYLYALLMVYGLSVKKFNLNGNYNTLKNIAIDNDLITESKFKKIHKQIKDMSKHSSQVSKMTLLDNVEKISESIPEGWDVVRQELEKYAIDKRQLLGIVDSNAVKLFQAAYYFEIVQNKDKYPAVRYTATLDNRTTEFCRSYNGKIFRVGDSITELIAPPNHFNCRSYLEPLEQGEFNESDIQETLLSKQSVFILPDIGFDFKLENMESLVDNYKYMYDKKLSDF